MRKLLSFMVVMLALVSLTFTTSCKEEAKAPMASFTWAVDSVDYKTVQFTNASQNYTSVTWDFGDGGTSTEENPTHTYAALGEFNVTIVAKGDGGTDTWLEKVIIADPNAELTKLVGEVSKTWKLIRVTTTGRYPIEVGPIDHSSIWWAQGLNNDEIANRSCMFDDEFIFHRDGLKMERKIYNTIWREGGWFAAPDNICSDVSNMLGPNGEDLSTWGDGEFTFTLEPGTEPKLKVMGLGAYAGYFKVGTQGGVSAEHKTPSDLVEYNIIKLTDDAVDTLIIEGLIQDGNAYWRHVLVHYDNPADEPTLPGNKPNAQFTYTLDGTTATFTNNTTGATSYEWNFGDGTTSTEMSPTHTFAGGPFMVTMNATNMFGVSTAKTLIFVTTEALTDDLLKGGAWMVDVEDFRVFVGPGMGAPDWWQVPKAALDGSSSGDGDWSCMADDEFIFADGGVYTYDGKTSVRNDGWFGSPNGCMAVADILLLPAPGPAFASGAHTYAFTPAAGADRAKIVLTNGSADRAAFIGFYKGYYGGENGGIYTGLLPNGGNATNQYEVMGYANAGGVEYLYITVDISNDHSGGASWSVILKRAS